MLNFDLVFMNSTENKLSEQFVEMGTAERKLDVY